MTREEILPSLSLDKAAVIRQQILDNEAPPDEDEHGLAETFEHVAARRNAPITEANATHGARIRPRAPDFFLHPHRRIILTHPDVDYEHIFETAGLSRRSERSALADGQRHPNNEKCISIMQRWYELCLDDPDSQDDVRAALNDDVEDFADQLLQCAPRKLSWDDNDVFAHAFKQVVEKRVGLEATSPYMLVEFQDGKYLRPDEPLIEAADSTRQTTLPLLGYPCPGHLVAMPKDGSFAVDEDKAEYSQEDFKIVKEIVRCGEALVRLGEEIAGCVTRKFVVDFMVPESIRQGRNVLDLQHITRAVKEILGEEWFDLPFDRNESLLDWTAAQVYEPGTQIDITVEDDDEEDEEEDGQGEREEAVQDGEIVGPELDEIVATVNRAVVLEQHSTGDGEQQPVQVRVANPPQESIAPQAWLARQGGSVLGPQEVGAEQSSSAERDPGDSSIQAAELDDQPQQAALLPAWASTVLERLMDPDEDGESPGSRAAGVEDYEGDDP